MTPGGPQSARPDFLTYPRRRGPPRNPGQYLHAQVPPAQTIGSAQCGAIARQPLESAGPAQVQSRSASMQENPAPLRSLPAAAGAGIAANKQANVSAAMPLRHKEVART